MNRAVDDTLAGARGAAASLAQIASALVNAASTSPPTHETLRHVAGVLAASAQRATLACLSLSAHAGRLETFAHVEQRAREHERDRVEAEAATDARNYTTEGETPEPGAYAAEAFAAWTEDEGGPDAFAPLGVDEARALYVAAFVRSVAGE
jgi:hypothetical protein